MRARRSGGKWRPRLSMQLCALAVSTLAAIRMDAFQGSISIGPLSQDESDDVALITLGLPEAARRAREGIRRQAVAMGFVPSEWDVHGKLKKDWLLLEKDEKRLINIDFAWTMLLHLVAKQTGLKIAFPCNISTLSRNQLDGCRAREAAKRIMERGATGNGSEGRSCREGATERPPDSCDHSTPCNILTLHSLMRRRRATERAYLFEPHYQPPETAMLYIKKCDQPPGKVHRAPLDGGEEEPSTSNGPLIVSALRASEEDGSGAQAKGTDGSTLNGDEPSNGDQEDDAPWMAAKKRSAAKRGAGPSPAKKSVLADLLQKKPDPLDARMTPKKRWLLKYGESADAHQPSDLFTCQDTSGPAN